jgi:hypothetical protein
LNSLFINIAGKTGESESDLSSIGGGIYIAGANAVNINGTTFKNILSIGSVGGLFIISGISVVIDEYVFEDINCINSGGINHLIFSYMLYLIFIFILFIYLFFF